MSEEITPGDVAGAVLGDLAADGDIDVTSWTDLEHLPREMDALAEQHAAIFGYAKQWVCQRAGFEPSPVCLLGPLAESMDLLVDVFAAVEDLGRRHWDDLHDAVVATTADLRTVDQGVADVLPVVV
jgi:hypothetical protein